MSSKALLEQASAIVNQHGRDTAADGFSDDAEAAFDVSARLDKLAETAELHDKLWAAARAVRVAEIAWVSGSRRMKRDLYNALISARLRLNTAITAAMAADTDGLNAGS